MKTEKGRDYFHENFKQGRVDLLDQIHRISIKQPHGLSEARLLAQLQSENQSLRKRMLLLEKQESSKSVGGKQQGPRRGAKAPPPATTNFSDEKPLISQEQPPADPDEAILIQALEVLKKIKVHSTDASEDEAQPLDSRIYIEDYGLHLPNPQLVSAVPAP